MSNLWGQSYEPQCNLQEGNVWEKFCGTKTVSLVKKEQVLVKVYWRIQVNSSISFGANHEENFGGLGLRDNSLYAQTTIVDLNKKTIKSQANAQLQFTSVSKSVNHLPVKLLADVDYNLQLRAHHNHISGKFNHKIFVLNFISCSAVSLYSMAAVPQIMKHFDHFQIRRTSVAVT